MNTWKQDTPSAMAVTITPEIAAAMLATSTGNRKMRAPYVERLANAMARGEWRVTNQGIGFDTTGALRDGHHRLSACVRSGVPIRSMVVMGMPNTAYEVIDTGALRNYGDRLNEPAKIAEMLSFAALIAYRCSVATASQIAPFKATSLYDLSNALLQYCGSSAQYFSSASMRLAACVAVMQGQRKEWVFNQYRALCLLDFDAMTSAGHSLVRQVQRMRDERTGSRGRTHRLEVLTRGLRVFDENRAHLVKIQLKENTIETTVDAARATLLAALNDAQRQVSLNLATP